MLLPSNVTVPEVTGISPAMHRARVDLPQPVSPTRPMVWPRPIVSDTPSTAWTCATVRLISPPPPLTGKYLTRLSTRTSTSSDAPCAVCAAPRGSTSLMLRPPLASGAPARLPCPLHCTAFARRSGAPSSLLAPQSRRPHPPPPPPSSSARSCDHASLGLGSRGDRLGALGGGIVPALGDGPAPDPLGAGGRAG